ncbi:MAG: DUF3012 domain-containing protein [Gammaproteobacteria bacterium]|nr:DUF3012 domain-containing protein [Gammaproteobacteria bacterium]MDH4253079.1 DUF3012 domain-containing protein [Gammaproteobacteria bacterium]MDH5308905.1 DUF3012 domain-containing protein [Gammaproteobacteria bacterium]
MTRKLLNLAPFVALALAACEPEVGSDAWCKNMEDKPKGDWTANEAVDYAKYCVMELDKE